MRKKSLNTLPRFRLQTTGNTGATGATGANGYFSSLYFFSKVDTFSSTGTFSLATFYLGGVFPNDSAICRIGFYADIDSINTNAINFGITFIDENGKGQNVGLYYSGNGAIAPGINITSTGHYYYSDFTVPSLNDSITLYITGNHVTGNAYSFISWNVQPLYKF